MTTRETSLWAYEKIKANGLLSRSRFLVYECLFLHGPQTAGEVTRRLQRPNEVHPSYHRRLDELGDLGVAIRVRDRPCGVTGNPAIEWATTHDLPSGTVRHLGGGLRPTDAEVRSALEDIRMLLRAVQSPGVHMAKAKARGLDKEAPIELVKLARWVQYKFNLK